MCAYALPGPAAYNLSSRGTSSTPGLLDVLVFTIFGSAYVCQSIENIYELNEDIYPQM